MIRERPGEGIHLVIEPFDTAHHPFRIHQLENPDRSWETSLKHRDEPFIKAIRGQELKDLFTD